MFYLEKILDKIIKIPCVVIKEENDLVLIDLPQAPPFVLSPCMMYVEKSQVVSE